ncbi:MAG TPA: tripartite tricarboxylate transporter permease [Ramlibacter sp.]|nr:tripartite tricarboxylate transporter permease [Ramlibacter sp.]
MDLLANLALGFSISLSPMNLGLALLGALLGTAVGVLPGLGPAATISLLLPVTLGLNHTSAIIMLAGIYYGAMYGGSITAILVRIPGEAASVVTCLDGYEMARRGRAGAALGISAFGSFIAGVFATLGVALVGPSLAQTALAFGPIEKASLVLFGLVLVAGVGSGTRPRAYAMIALGLLLSSVGIDLVTGTERFTFGTAYLRDGINIAVMAMGLFGISEVLMLAERQLRSANALSYGKSLRDLLPTRQDWKDSAMPIGRGTVLGFFLGLLPGGGAMISSFMSYLLEKRLSPTPERFGQGAIEGVAGPESANNAAAQSSFVPLLCLGIPANAVIGIIMGAFILHGISPGPRLIVEHPGLFWGVVTSMFLGNLMLVVLNVPLIGLFVSLLRVPQALMAPLIVMFCAIGAYSLNNSAQDVLSMATFGLAGYALRKAGFELAPLLLAFILGSLLEQSVKQGLLIGYGNPLVFFQKPISAVILTITICVLLWPLAKRFLRRA